LDPETLFLALAGDDWPSVRAGRLEACSECHRCVEVCPSHIRLLDWFRWGKSGLREQARAEAARARFLARNARLARERDERAAATRELRAARPAAPPAQAISREDVLAAIARGRSRRERTAASAVPSDVPRDTPGSGSDASQPPPRGTRS
jgi:electron transport complex protein RnfC